LGTARRCGRGPTERKRHAEDGFTLLELLIVISILPIVIGGIAVATISSFRSQIAVSARLADSHDAQITSAYFARDVQTATSVSTSTTTSLCPSGSGTQLLGLSWTTASGTVTVSYGFSSGTSSPYLVRRYCQGASSPVVVPLSTGLFSGLAAPTYSHTCPSSGSSCATSGGKTNATVTVRCQDGTTSCANAGSIPTYPSSSAPGVSSVSIRITEYPSGYTYSLTASPRNQQAPGYQPPGSAGPPLVLLGTGTSVLSCIGSGHGGPVTVNGAAAINSPAAGSLAFGNNNGIVASEIYTQDPSTSGASVPVNPPSAYSGPYVEGPPFPDPYASLVDPSISPTYNGTSLQGPGVYTNPGGISISGTQTLPSGIYVFEHGLSVTGQVSGTNVMLFIGIPNAAPGTPQDATYSVSGNGGVTIAAPTSGYYAGLSIFQARTDTNALQVAGNGSNSTYGGVIYAAGATISSMGNGSVAAGSIVAKTLACGGNGGFAVGFAVVSSTPSSGTINLGASTTDTVSVVGAPGRGAPDGTVSFYVCGPTAVATSCGSKSTQVGAAVPLVAGANNTSTATSASFQPTQPGYWCFGSYFNGDPNYGASSDTSLGECVLVEGPSIQLTFPVNGASYVIAGSAKGSWNKSDPCGSGAICGTATDVGGTVTKVEFNVKQASSGKCWSAVTSKYTATCNNWVTVSPLALPNWTQAWQASNFTAGSYEVDVRATDSQGVTATATATITMT
jgi:prepilin-type N-terminal cleavage/methylation domain-containing protein